MPVCCEMRRISASSSGSRNPRPEVVARCGQRVEIARRRELRRLERVLGRRSSDDDTEVIRRTRRGAECADLLVDPLGEARRVEQRLGLLEQQALVGRAAALGDEQESVLVAVDRADLDLGRQVGAGVDLVPHVERRHLRIAQIAVAIRLEHALCERGLVTTAGEHVLAALALDDRGAGVLAAGQHEAGGDRRVLQEVEGDEPIVGRGLGIVENLAQLCEVARAVADARCRASPRERAASAPPARSVRSRARHR